MIFLYVLLSATLLTIRQVPADTRLHVRLTTTVGSYASRAGTPVSAVLIAPVAVGGETVLPAGTTLSGQVRSVRRVGLGFVHETAAIGLVFDQLKLPGGEAVPISCRVEQVDNGRERVTRDGRILGERATGSLSYRTGGYIRIFLQWQVHARLATWAIKTLLVQVPESEIYYPAGVELTLNLTNNVVLNAPLQSAQTPRGLAQEEREHLAPLVSSMPYRTVDPASNRPADLINVLFAGTAGQLEKAFVAAGWERANPASFRSRVRGIRSVAEGRSYRGAPMSSLLLNQRGPNMSWQKGLNDFSKRDHIRVWKQPGDWQGQEFWAGAATRDIGFAYRSYTRRITHKIEEDIDEERAKVTNDLAFTSCVDLIDWMDRPGIPRSTHNARGDLMSTDTRLAVLRLNDCPYARMSTESFDLEPVPRRGGILQRFARREILSVRNDLLRGNLIYRTYEGTRWVVGAMVRHRRRVLAAHPVHTTPSVQPAAMVSAPAS
jgi:LssY C-terminus